MPSVPLEKRLLRDADVALRAAAQNHDSRMEVLECAAAIHSGIAPDAFSGGARKRGAPARRLLLQIADTPIPVPLALAALARPELDVVSQKRSGAFYTDWRLATMLASGVPSVDPSAPELDPASGTGVLLAARALTFDKPDRDEYVATAAHAADLDSRALRGVRVALGACASSEAALSSLTSRLVCHDSLQDGQQAWGVGKRFKTVIANPPWERLKVTKHEFAADKGVGSHYGDAVESSLEGLGESRSLMARYARDQVSRHRLHGSGEADLYRLFLSLAFELVDDDGRVSFLVPAGLIRSQGTADLRRHLLAQCSEVDVTILHNHAAFFGTDSRLKFCELRAVVGGRKSKSITLKHAEGSPTGTTEVGRVVVNRSRLAKLRPDLTVPEVRTDAEWRLFKKLSDHGHLSTDSSAWKPLISREIDMTRERPLFSTSLTPRSVPIIEGRMVAAFHTGAKSHVSGTGRAAIWQSNQWGEGDLNPQFWISRGDLPNSGLERVDVPRAGFCDITGQTNERTLIASLIPAGVACGNKVPTVLFEGEDSEPRQAAWVAMINSFVVDWLARRLCTTTINYFVLRGIPLPEIDPAGAGTLELALLAQRISDGCEGRTSVSSAELVHMRARADALVMAAFKLDINEASLVLADFPLLDRGQPKLPGELRSTVTRDTLLSVYAEHLSVDSTPFSSRAHEAAAIGAIAYQRSEASRAARACQLAAAE